MEYQLKGKSDVQEVTERAKKSMSSFEKNVEGVQQRFKSFGKDLFLSFFAPMVLFNAGLSYISAQIEKKRQEIEEAKKFAEEAESKFLSAETKALAQERARREREAKEKGLAGKAKGIEMQEALKNQPLTMQEIMELMSRMSTLEKASFAILRGLGLTTEETMIEELAGRSDFQSVMADIMRRRSATKPTTTASQEKFSDAKAVSGNVIGVGQSPVIAAMTETNDLLRSIDNKLTPPQSPLTPDPNQTYKGTMAAPSRAALLKAGIK